MMQLAARSTLFPYTTLFRSLRPLLPPHGRDAPVRAHHEAVHPETPRAGGAGARDRRGQQGRTAPPRRDEARSEEHTSELQSLRHLVCRLLLEKKKQKTNNTQ